MNKNGLPAIFKGAQIYRFGLFGRRHRAQRANNCNAQFGFCVNRLSKLHQNTETIIPVFWWLFNEVGFRLLNQRRGFFVYLDQQKIK